MLELSRAQGGWRMAYGGDTYNTSLYLARLGVPTGYLTAVGSDPFSVEMLASWKAEGLNTSFVLIDTDGLPGLYAIRTDDAGERCFFYWREQAAVRRLFSLPGIEAAFASAAKARLLYLSGITLSLFDGHGVARVAELCAAVRENGGDVAFDPNYRARGWRCAAAACEAIDHIAPFVSIALPTYEDEALLRSDSDPRATIDRWLGFGAQEVAVKLGADGCVVANAEQRVHVPTFAKTAIDTTGAGDAFNGGYLAARINGCVPHEAGTQGNNLAGEVVRHRGAIIPVEAMLASLEDSSAHSDQPPNEYEAPSILR